MSRLLATTILSISLLATDAGADEVRLTNGDTINGDVISLDAEQLKLKSTNFGEIAIDRKLVAAIGLGEDGLPQPTVVAPQPAGVPLGGTGGLDVGSMMRDPAVQQQFGTLLSEALGGRPIGDVQRDLQKSRRQLQELQQDLGGIEGEALGSYLKMFDMLGQGLGTAGDLGGMNRLQTQAPPQPVELPPEEPRGAIDEQEIR